MKIMVREIKEYTLDVTVDVNRLQGKQPGKEFETMIRSELLRQVDSLPLTTSFGSVDPSTQHLFMGGPSAASETNHLATYTVSEPRIRRDVPL
jgi:hypothetical protein